MEYDLTPLPIYPRGQGCQVRGLTGKEKERVFTEMATTATWTSLSGRGDPSGPEPQGDRGDRRVLLVRTLSVLRYPSDRDDPGDRRGPTRSDQGVPRDRSSPVVPSAPKPPSVLMLPWSRRPLGVLGDRRARGVRNDRDLLVHGFPTVPGVLRSPLVPGSPSDPGVH